MSRYYGGWAPYVPVAERRRKAEREMEKLRKKGSVVSPVRIEGRLIARSFWGKAWCDNLESYRDYENRLPRGRSYVRNGSVVDLQIAPREVTATVSGSALYKVKVSIGEVAKARWKTLCADCSGGIDSLVELLQGRFSKRVMERICRQDAGLFPRPSEIRFTCSCPDSASMCKHIAAVLYGVGSRLDDKPELLFRLRAVDEAELLSDLGTALPDTVGERDSATTLVGDDLAALFGLDMTETGATAPAPSNGGAPAWRATKVGKGVARKVSAGVAPSTVTPARLEKPHPPARRANAVSRDRKSAAAAPAKTAVKKSDPKSTVARVRVASAKPAMAVDKRKSRPAASAGAATTTRKGADKAPAPPRRRSGAAPVPESTVSANEAPHRQPSSRGAPPKRSTGAKPGRRGKMPDQKSREADYRRP